MPRVTVRPKTGGGWQVTGDTQTHNTQRGVSDGGELVVKGRYGHAKVRLHQDVGTHGYATGRG